jgi:uncharacterized membrane protein HdeD (DUF308 family)
MTAIPSDNPLKSAFHQQVREAGARLVWIGVALVVLGVAALVFPAVSTLVATMFVGWLLLLSGLVTVFGSFSIRGTGPFFGALLLGLLSVAAGLFMLVRPLAGELAITLTLGFLFMLQGAYETFLAFEVRPGRAWGWMLVSALASIVLALVIIIGLPGVSLFALGVVLGVNLITSGLGYAFVGNAVKQGV